MLKVQVLAVLAAGVLAVVAVITLWSADAASERDPSAVRTVTVRNDCARAVWLFYGLTPPLRPQDAVQLARSGAVAQPMLEGDTIWLLDDDRAALDDVRIAAATDTVIIGPSCTTIVAASGEAGP